MNVATRIATEADLAAMASLHRASITTLCAGHYDHAQITAWTAMLTPEAYLPALRHKVCLVAHDGQGDLTGLGILDAKTAEVSAVYAHPAHAGQGVGAALLAALEGRAVERGIQALHVAATLNAQGFYLRHGYARLGPGSHTLADGTRLACVRMYKSLGAQV